MKIKVLESGRANHEYYHYTDVNGLIGILKSNELISSLESEGLMKDKFIVSFSRLGKGTQVDPRIVKSPAIVKIIFDGEKLANNYKLVPFDYYEGTTRLAGKSENEEALVLGSKSDDSEVNKVSVIIYDNNKFLCKIIFIKNSDDLFEVKDILTGKGKAIKLSKDKWEFPNKKIYTLQYMELNSELEVGLILNPSDNPKLKRVKVFKGSTRINTSERRPSITNIKKYIKGIQFSDKLEDNDNWMYFIWTPVEYLERELEKGKSSGLNGDSSGFKVSHNIKTYRDLKKSQYLKGIPISYYKSPKRGFKKV